MYLKAFVLPALALAFFVASPVAFADSVYTAPTGIQYSVPTGYQAYAYGIYYNPSTGVFFNPLTGQTSQIVPAGPALMAQNGLPAVPANYSSALYGTYYAGSNGVYYDPVSGFMSYMLPPGPKIVGYVAPLNQYTPGATYTTNNYYTNPPLPNTGAGGEAGAIRLTLLISGGIAVLGTLLLRRKMVLR